VTHDQIEAMTMATRIAIMNAGVIQQFDTPDAVYEKPANLFVAGFIGSPAMNLFPATVSTAGGVTAKLAGSGVRVDLSHYPFVAAPRDGASVTLGFRPEHFLAPNQASGAAVAATFSLPVQYTEKTGAEATGYFNTDKGLLAVSIAPEQIGQFRQGDVANLSFPHDKLHAFDSGSGQRL